MDKYLIKVEEGFDVAKLMNLGEVSYYDSLDNVLFFKTDKLANELLNIQGVLLVEKSRMFRVGI